MWESTSSGSGSESGDDTMQDDRTEKTDWRKVQSKKGRKEVKKISKKEAKKARRLARSKENRLSVAEAAVAAALNQFNMTFETFKLHCKKEFINY